MAEVAAGTEEDALDAVGAAHDALAGWAATPARQRAECLRRTFELMTRDADALARLMVAELVASAAAEGGTIVTGGRAPDRRGYFYQPTVIDQVPAGASILGTEIFGSVAPVVRFTAEADAVAWANDTEFGLVSDPAAPFGGVKQSGIGREGAHEGLLEFTETKYIATNW